MVPQVSAFQKFQSYRKETRTGTRGKRVKALVPVPSAVRCPGQGADFGAEMTKLLQPPEPSSGP